MNPAAVLSVLVQARGIEETNRRLKDIDKTSQRTAKSTDKLERKFSSLDTTVGDFNRSMTAAGNVVKLVKFPAMIAGAGMAAQALGSLAAAGVAAGAALAPLAGASAGVAGGYIAMGQAAGVAKLALSGLEDAISGDKDALKKLTPTQKAFVKELQSTAKEARGLRGSAQRGLFPGLTDALESINPLFDRLRPVIGSTATVMGQLARQAGALVGSDGVMDKLVRIGTTNVAVLRHFGIGAIALGHGLLTILDAARPLTKWFSELAMKTGLLINGQANLASKSGALVDFFEQTRVVMSRVGRIAADVAVGLFNIAKAGKPLGDELLVSVVRLAEKFKDWTQSATGKNQIAEYFRNARGPILEIVGLFGDVAGAVLRLSRPTSGTSGLIAMFRPLVPVLEQVVSSTTAAFGPTFVQALTEVARLFGALAGSSGPLVVFVRLIGDAAGALADLLSNNPELQAMVVTFAGLAAVIKAVNFISMVTGISTVIGAINGLKAAYIAQTGAQTASTLAAVKWRASTIASSAAVAAAGGPIGALVLVLGAVAAAFLIMNGRTRSVAAASRDLNDALRVQADALRAVRDIDIDVAARKANLATANVSVEQAEKRLADVRKNSHSTSLDIKQAEADLEQARVSQTRATRDMSDVEADATRKREDASKATDVAHQKTRDLVAAKEADLRKTEGLIKTQQAYASTLTTGSVKAREMAGEIGALRTRAVQLREEIAKLEDKKVEVRVDLVLAPGGGKPFTNPFDKTTGDGIGSALSSSVGQMARRSAGSLIGDGGGGSLMGAKSIMSPFVSMAGRFGLHTSSGLRPGAITSSGNPSYHGTGNAVDEAGSPAGMLGYFKYLRSNFGSRLRELIYTPGGVGIKDGRPFRYTGQVAADHFDHVHVAFTGAGDGIGRAPRTGDGIGDIKALWTKAGGSSGAQNLAAAVAMAESGGNASASNRNSDGSIDRGLWQINSVHGSQSTFDRLGNAKAAVSISKNGRNWNPWVAYTNGSYKRFLGAASKTKATSVSTAKGKTYKTNQTASGGALGGYDPSVVYGTENAATLPDPFTGMLGGAAGFAQKMASPLLSASRSLKGGGPTKGISTAEGERRANLPELPSGPTWEDYVMSGIARAKLTAGTDDDISALTTLTQLRKEQMDVALSDSDPRNDADAIDAYLQAKDSLDALNESVKAQTEAIEAQRKAYETLMAQDYQKQFNVSQSQYSILAGAITDVVNGRLGSTLGLGLSGLRAAPGSVARS